MYLLRVAGRAVLRLLAVVLFVLIRNRRTTLAVGAVLIVGWIALANLERLPVPGLAPSVGGATAASASRDLRVNRPVALSAEAVPAVDNYIKGLTTFDAGLMWNSLSDDAINAMKTRGGSVDALQAGLDDAKRRGARYEDITLVGNYPLQNGGKYMFYVLSRRGFSGPDQLEQVYFVFTVNREGKITRIE